MTRLRSLFFTIPSTITVPSRPDTCVTVIDDHELVGPVVESKESIPKRVIKVRGEIVVLGQRR